MKRLFNDLWMCCCLVLLLVCLVAWLRLGALFFGAVRDENAFREEQGRKPVFFEDRMDEQAFRLPARATYRGSVYFGAEHYPCELVLNAKDEIRGQRVWGALRWTKAGREEKVGLGGHLPWDVLRLKVNWPGGHSLYGATLELRSDDLARSLAGEYHTAGGVRGKVVVVME